MTRHSWSRAAAAVLLLIGAVNVQAVEFANIDVVDGAAPTNTTPPTVSIVGGTASFFLDPGAVVGEIPVRIGASASDDYTGGVLVSIARETGRFPVDGPSLTVPLSASTSTVTDDDTTSLNGRNVSGGLSLVTRRAGSNVTSATYPAGNATTISGVMNANLSAAYFPFSEGWKGGTVTSTLNENPLNTFVGSAGITFDPVIGPTNTSNVRPSFYGAGQNFVSIPGVTDSRQQGILLAMGAKNEDNFGQSSANLDGSGWNVMTKSNAVDGTGTGEVDPFSFVFVPLGTPNMTMGVIWGAGGGTTGEPLPILRSGANFTITRDTTVNGQFNLSIPGQTPSSGVLIVGGESNLNGSGGLPGDNLVTTRPNAAGTGWEIISDDLPTANSTSGQNGQSGEPIPYFHFVFMPFNAAPTAPGAIPAPAWTKESVFAYDLEITELDGADNDNDNFLPADPPLPGLLGPGVLGAVEAATPGLNIVPSNMNRGDQRTHINGVYPTQTDGVMFATVSEGNRDNSATGGISGYGVVAVSPAGNQWKVSTAGADPNTGEANFDYAVAFFGANSGFQMGANVQPAASPVGLGQVTLSGVNANTDGVLMVNASGPVTANTGSEDNYVTMSPKADGTGWDVQVLDNGATGQNFGFNYVYLPYDAENLIAGSVNADGTLKNSTGTGVSPGQFTLTKEATGSYLLTVAGKTPTDGMLMLVGGNGDVASADNSMSYEAAGNAFRILGVDMVTVAETEQAIFPSLEDTAFQFAYIDYDAPPAIAGPGTFLAADFNQSGTVDATDLATWRSGFDTGTTNAQGDADVDGDVDGSDFLLWQQQLGTTPATAVAGTVPEPSAALLALLAAAGLAARKRK